MNNYVYAIQTAGVSLTTLAESESEAVRILNERITHLRNHGGVSLPSLSEFELISVYPAPFWAATKKLDK